MQFRNEIIDFFLRIVVVSPSLFGDRLSSIFLRFSLRLFLQVDEPLSCSKLRSSAAHDARVQHLA